MIFCFRGHLIFCPCFVPLLFCTLNCFHVAPASARRLNEEFTYLLTSNICSGLSLCTRKTAIASPNHLNLLPYISGTHHHIIFHPFPLLLLSGRDSSTSFFRVSFPVIPHYPLTTCFVMSAHPQLQLRPDTPHRLANAFQVSAYD